jgi:hypothetical protein
MTTTVIVTVPDVVDPIVVQIEFADAVMAHDIGVDEPSALYDERPDFEDDLFDPDPVAGPW